MLAKRVSALPELDESAEPIANDAKRDSSAWMFEPKWDGFRVLVFRDGDEVLLQSRDEKSLTRYFPEVVPSLLAQLPERAVLDGEIVCARGGALDFEALSLRIHPAASRVRLLSRELPASLVFWDLLAVGHRSLLDVPFAKRREELETILGKAVPPIHLTPVTRDIAVARDWFQRFEGAGLDGVMAKLADGLYEPNKRVMLKVKHERECDCVVAGFRWHKSGQGTSVGSLLLGLYDPAGALQHVGVSASFTAEKRRALVAQLTPYRVTPTTLAAHPWRHWAEADSETPDEAAFRMPGGKSRWSQRKDLSWEPLSPELVVQVSYDHMQGSRFRHTTQFRRWRMDKPPRQCTYEQLEVVTPRELSEVFAEAS